MSYGIYGILLGSETSASDLCDKNNGAKIDVSAYKDGPRKE